MHTSAKPEYSPGDQREPSASSRPGASGNSEEPDASAISVALSNLQDCLIVDIPRLQALARRVLAGEGVQRADVSITLLDNPAIHRINRDHLKHDWPTDVITFPLSQPDEPELAGELVVSAEMAGDTARALDADPHAELALYLVHGLLHLCGYDDIGEEDTRRMRAREDAVLAREGLPNTFSLVERRAVLRPQQEQPAWST